MNFDRIRELLWEQTFHSSKLSSVLVMLEEVGKFISGRTPKSDELASIGDIPYFKVGDMNTEGNEKFLRITSLFLKEKAGKTFPAGAIVYPKNGGAVFTNKRRILATESVIDLNTGGFVCDEKLNQEYAYMFFLGLDFRRISKGTALPTIDQKKLHQTKIPVPSLEEQSSIVTRLEEAFAEIDRAEKAYEELQTLAGVLRGQILQEAIQGKLVPQLAEEGVVEPVGVVPEKVPFEIPESWKWIQFKQTCSSLDGKRIPLKKDDRAKREKRYPYYGATGVIDFVDDYIFDGVFLLIGEDGANLLSRSKDNAFIANGKIWVNNHAHVFEENGVADLRYLALMINATSLNPYVTGSAQPKLTQKNLYSIPVPIPPIKEQVRIVAKVEELLTQVAALSTR